VLGSDEQRLAMIERGLRAARGLTWETCAERTMGVYQSAFEATCR
jgi:hypothetical protein